MNTTYISEPVNVEAAMLRRAADLTEMIGHPVDYHCASGYGRKGMILRFVSVVVLGDEARIMLRMSETPTSDEYFTPTLCRKCEVSVVMELGTVTA